MNKGFKALLQQNKKVLFVQLASLGILLLGFALCRYAFFGLHGMKEWPVDLLLAGLIVHMVSLLARKQYVPWFTSVGYSLGFWLGVIFHMEGFDPGGGRTDNLWQIWTMAFAVCILAGVVLEIVMKWRKLLKKR